MGQYFDNDNLPSKIRSYSCFIRDKKYIFNVDIGVFSKSGLDFGTRLLLENINLDNIEKNVLDLGCGYGPVGVFFASYGFNVDMVDVNKRALHLSKINLEENKMHANVFYSDCYKNVEKKYSCIVVNPPIRAGKKVVEEMCLNSINYLDDNGYIYIVIRKDMGGKSLFEKLSKIYKESKIIIKKSGYIVICCEKC